MSATELAIIENAGMVTPTFRTRGRDPRYLSLDFADGTPCDLDAVNRSTIVDLYCGPKYVLANASVLWFMCPVLVMKWAFTSVTITGLLDINDCI